MSAAEAPLLLVEDSDDDAFLFEHAIASHFHELPVRVVTDGERAVDYLDGVGAFADRDAHPLPGLVALDLKLPRRSGLEVLAHMRGHVALQGIPVVILSSSQEIADVQRARALGIDDYRVKPVNLAELEEVVRAIGERWCVRVRGATGR